MFGPTFYRSLAGSSRRSVRDLPLLSCIVYIAHISTGCNRRGLRCRKHGLQNQVPTWAAEDIPSLVSIKLATTESSSTWQFCLYSVCPPDPKQTCSVTLIHKFPAVRLSVCLSLCKCCFGALQIWRERFSSSRREVRLITFRMGFSLQYLGSHSSVKLRPCCAYIYL